MDSFNKVWNNKYLRFHILSFIKDKNNNNNNCNDNLLYHDYNSTTMLSLMIDNMKIDMIYDKLKSNKYILITQNKILNRVFGSMNSFDGISPLDPSLVYKCQQVGPLLWFKYQDRIKCKDPISNELISERTLISIFKLWYCNNSSDSLCKDLRYYRFYSLIYKAIEYGYFELLDLILELMGGNSSLNGYKDQSSTVNSSCRIEDEIKHLIYSGAQIPIYSHYGLVVNGLNFNENLNFIENKLKFNYSYLLNGSTKNIQILSNSNQDVLKRSIEILLNNHSSSVKVEGSVQEKHLSNKGVVEIRKFNCNIHYILIYFLDIINQNWDQSISTQHINFKNYLKSNQICNIQSLVLAAQQYYSKKELSNYLGCYFIYYQLLLNNCIKKEIKEYNPLFILFHSVYSFSIDYYHIAISYGDQIESGKKIKFNYNETIDLNNSTKETSSRYFKHLLDQENISNKIWVKIFKYMMYSYNFEFIHWLFESLSNLYSLFKTLLLSNVELFIEISAKELLRNKATDCSKVKFIFNILNQECSVFNSGNLKSKFFINSKIIPIDLSLLLVNHLLKLNLNGANKVMDVFIKSVLEFENDLFGNYRYIHAIKQYCLVDKELLKQYSNQNEFSNPLLIDRSRFLINSLINSILYLDYKAIINIISIALNNSNQIIYIPESINNSLEIIKYLYNNNYLREFNIQLFLECAIENLIIEKEFIEELLSDSNQNLTRHLASKIFVTFNNTTSLRRNNSIVEKINEEVDEYWIRDNLYAGNFELVYHYLLKKPGERNQIWISLQDIVAETSMSVEWFGKLYYPYFQYCIGVDVVYLCSLNLDIFEFLWEHHYNLDSKKIDFLNLLFHKDCFIFNQIAFQLMEYILREKKEFIINCGNNNQFLIFNLMDLVLVYGDISTIKTLLSYPNIGFKISSDIVVQLISISNCRYDLIEYFFSSNLIQNFKDILNNDILDNLIIQEYNDPLNISNNKIVVTKSMFILIHTIIKLQNN